MRKCNACSRSTFDTAKFCHHCGAKMMAETLDCPSCNYPNVLGAKICEHCDFDFFAPAPPPTESTTTSIVDDLSSDEIQDTLDLHETVDAPEDLPIVEDPPIGVEDITQEESLTFLFEKTAEEIAPQQVNKADIVFEIIEDSNSKKEDKNEKTVFENPTDHNNLEEIIEEVLEEDTEKLDLNNPPPVNDLFEKNPNENIEQEIFDKFSIAFENQIKIEQNHTKYNQYVDRFEASDFKLSFEFRIKQLAEEVQKIRLDDANLLKDESALLDRAFTELIDYFVIRYCADLNDVFLPESILQYQNIAPENIDLAQMVFDYLDFKNEQERVHFDFIKMPMQRLKNASKAFLFPEKGEKIFFICDQTILGSGKEGFAMTEKAIYWKMQFETAERVYYKNLKQIAPQKNWITINEMFFNTNPSLNIKLLKLLKKLKTIL